MMLAATLSRSGRAARRIPAARPATLRDASQQPIDIFIENLSAVGFGMSTLADLPHGARVSLRLAGIGPREAQVVRRLGLSYGCEFARPLDANDLATALDAGAVVNGRFGSEDEKSSGSADTTRVPPLGRIAVLCSVNILLWSTIIFSLRAFIA